jgi:hypothetical protein
MKNIIMGHERYREVLASVGLQPSDHNAPPDAKIVPRLWEALKRACNEDFIVRVEERPGDR